ncbi:MAG: nuclease-related domain-containing protein [Methanocellales archaeon]|nr:nuclease-related domain-containing protein [Methanocellales archaeon]
MGETLVEEYLKELNDNYYLINDIMLPERYGNIDHILFCPNGIFVIETKNYEGEIICDGDEWHRHYEGGFTISMRGRPYWKEPIDYDIRSPSKSVKGNAVKLKQLIESQRNIFRNPIKIWVEGIVVFTDPNVNLKLNKPTVTVLKVEELCDYLKNKESKLKFSSKELELIENLILMQAKGHFN